MKLKKTFAFILSLALILPCFGVAASALVNKASANSQEQTEMSSEIVIKNGAAAVVSMTYDDGKYDSMVWINEMLKKYNLKASSMLIANRIEKDNYLGTLEEWQALFAEGYISPENHSMTHSTVLPGTEWAKYEDYKDNNTEANYQIEILDSKTMLEGYFGQPIITFAPSNNTLWTDAAAVVMANYYAMRKGTRANSHNTVQSISPIEGSDAYGGWYNPYMYGIDTTTLEQNKAWVEDCIDAGGWFISMTHEILNSSDGADKPEKFEAFYQFLAEKQAANEIWVASFSEATVYLREKQNSSSTAYLSNGSVFVNVTMSDFTGDGLPLSSDIFDMPLTVKVEVPSDWVTVSYQLGSQTVKRTTFKEGTKNYAYVDAVPNGAAVELSAAETNAAITDVSVTLGEDFNINYYTVLAIDESISDYSMRFTTAKNSIVSTEYTEKDGKYIFSFKNIGPHQLGMNVKAELLKGGVPVAEKEYSVESYCDKLLSDASYSFNDDLTALINDVFVYAKAAERYVNAHMGGANVYETQDRELHPSSYLPLSSDTILNVAGENNGDLYAYSAGVVFGTQNKIYFKISSNSPDEHTVILDGKSYKVSELTKDGEYYQVFTESISPKNFDSKVTLTLNDGTKLTTITYSVNTYIYQIQKSTASATFEMKSLSLALYRYGKSCEKYAGTLEDSSFLGKDDVFS